MIELTNEQKSNILYWYHHDFLKVWSSCSKRMHIALRKIIPMRTVKLPYLQKHKQYDAWHAEMMKERRDFE